MWEKIKNKIVEKCNKFGSKVLDICGDRPWIGVVVTIGSCVAITALSPATPFGAAIGVTACIAGGACGVALRAGILQRRQEREKRTKALESVTPELSAPKRTTQVQARPQERNGQREILEKKHTRREIARTTTKENFRHSR